MLFSRAVGVEYPTGHLLCEFEVGLSLKIALTRGYKKTVKNLKRTPVLRLGKIASIASTRLDLLR